MKNTILLFSLLAFLTYGSQPALAESNDTAIKQPKQLKKPLQNSGKTNEAECDGDAERERCQNEELAREDKKLNRAYQQLMNSIATPTKQTKLRETEREWLQFVEKNCQFEASTFSGGSLEPITFTECRIRHTKARSAELTDQYTLCNSYGAC